MAWLKTFSKRWRGSASTETFLHGAATVLVLVPPMTAAHYNAPTTRFYNPAPSTTEALRQDWIKIGQDMYEAIEKTVDDGQYA